MGFHRSDVTRWSKGSQPRQATLQKIANYFDVQISSFFDEEKAPTQEGERENQVLVNSDEELTEFLEQLRNRPEMRMLFSVSKGATKADIEKAVAIIEALRKTEGQG